MTSYVGMTACNKPKIKKEMYSYFLAELEEFCFHGAIVTVDEKTMKLDIHGPGWFCVSWSEGIGEGKDAIDPFLALLVEVLETSCLIECGGISKNESPFKSMAIEIIAGSWGYRVSHFETKFTQTKKARQTKMT
jgi:hypothetical protein